MMSECSVQSPIIKQEDNSDITAPILSECYNAQSTSLNSKLEIDECSIKSESECSLQSPVIKQEDNSDITAPEISECYNAQSTSSNSKLEIDECSIKSESVSECYNTQSTSSNSKLEIDECSITSESDIKQEEEVCFMEMEKMFDTTDTTEETIIDNVGSSKDVPKTFSQQLSYTTSSSSLKETTLLRGATKRNFCIYCKELKTKFTRHIKTVHAEEEDIIKLSALSPKSQHKAIAEIRNKGINEFNNAGTSKIYKKRSALDSCVFCGFASGDLSRHFHKRHREEPQVLALKEHASNSKTRQEMMIKLREDGIKLFPVQNKTSPRIPCPGCKNLFSKHTLHKHYKKHCNLKHPTDNLQVESRMMSLHSQIPDKYAHIRKLLAKLRPDNISDKIIHNNGLLYLCDLWFKKYGHNTSGEVNVRTDLRQLSRLVIEAHKICDEINELDQLFLVCNYDIFIEAAKKMGGYNIKDNTFKSPSVPRYIGIIMSRACKGLKIKFIKDKNEEMLKELSLWKELHHSDFALTMGFGERQNAKASSRKKPRILQ